MNKIFLSNLLSALIVFSYSSTAYALPEDVEKVEFWAPPLMLKGQEYDVAVVLASYSSEETKFDVISNNENIVSVINSEITIEPFKSHGIAKVRTKSVGKVDLFAVSGEKLLTTSVEVMEPALMPAKLDIVLPSNKVAVRQIPAYVYLFDAFGNPLRATEDIEVNISPFGNVKTQVSKTVIKKDMHYSKFIVNVEGDGGITASADNLESDTEMIDFGIVSDDIVLKVKIAPDVLASSSSGELYVWLEKGEKPFIPDTDVKVKLSSEDSRFLAFSKAVQFTAPLDRDLVSTAEIFIKKGMSFAHTMVWTTDLLMKNAGQNFTSNDTENESEEITVTAISGGFGSASTTVEIRNPIKQEPNIAKVFALPNPVFDKLDIIVALYFSADEAQQQEEQQQEEQEEIEEQQGDFQPVVISDSVMATIATDSLLKPEFESVRIGKDDLDKRDHYTVIPARTLGKLGLSKITGTAGGARGEQIEIRVEEKYSLIPTIAIKPLPTLTNMEQDMFLVYITKDSVIVDSEIKGLVINTKPIMQFENIFDINSLKVVNGKSPNLVPSKSIDVTAVAPGFIGTVTTVSVSNPELRHIVAYHPPTVHTAEPFPVVFYVTDENKHPIEIVEPSVSPTKDFVRVSKGMYTLSSSREYNFVFYAEGVNPGTSKVSAFSHDIKFDASVSENEFDIGDDIVLTYQVVPADAKVTLGTDLPFERNSNGFTLETTIPGSHTLVLTAEKEGFNKVIKEIQIEIKNPTSTITPETSGINVTNFSPDTLKSNPTMLLGLIGVIIAIAGAAFYVLNRRKSKRTTNITPEGDLTFLFRGGSASWISI